MQLYDRGIRRRLAPMLSNRKLIDLAYSLLFTLPGTPVIRYGEEIGMGDDLTLKERDSVRTPMQWSDELNAGFSTAQKTVRPVIDHGPYAYSRVNVAASQRDPNSLLSLISRMIRQRKASSEIGLGEWKILPSDSPSVLGMRYTWHGQTLTAFHNFSPQPQRVKLHSSGKELWRSIVTEEQTVCLAEPGQSVLLEGYGYRWYRKAQENARGKAASCGN